MILQGEGILDINPEIITKKHEKQSSWKYTSILETKDDLSNYYKWLLSKRFNLTLISPLRGSHITIINDKIEKEIDLELLKKYHNFKINFAYDTKSIRSNGQHWWMNIKIPEAEDIREELGFKRRPYFGFHLTLGYANDRNLVHSNYILKTCIKLNL